MKMLQQGKGKFDQRQVWSSIVRIWHLFAEHTISGEDKDRDILGVFGQKRVMVESWRHVRYTAILV